MRLKSCVTPDGFIYGIHKPSFTSTNLRINDALCRLGRFRDGSIHDNTVNFPSADINEEHATWIYELPNPLPFRGTTFIKKDWADANAAAPEQIALPAPPATSMIETLEELLKTGDPSAMEAAFARLPESILLALATTSTDPRDLVRLAHMSCEFVGDEETGKPTGLLYEKHGTRIRPAIINEKLFEALANNGNLPDHYKDIMVLRPGVQGASEIVGEYDNREKDVHIFEYLRRNSYIAGGHYASNMANDSIRYSTGRLSIEDMAGLRHLYYQRIYIRLADMLGIEKNRHRMQMSANELESLRLQIIKRINNHGEGKLSYNATLWGWNYGFDYAPTGYRLHASHQQIHQQFAMLPDRIEAAGAARKGDTIAAYGCGDMVADFADTYRKQTGNPFFEDYIRAIRNNTRTDGQAGHPASLIIFEDANVMIFVPKAQTSQWELQLVCLKPVGNILEADLGMRASLDQAILIVQKVYDAMGARMVTTIEYPKRLDNPDSDQRLLYAFLPKLPESPGAFSEAQLRWIIGHYPEDFALACRNRVEQFVF